MKTTRLTAVIVSTLTLAVGACARNATLQPEGSTREAISTRRRPVIVTVTNNNYSDMRIYAVGEGGLPFRIGTATGYSSTTLVVRPSNFPTGTLRLVASPIGGQGSAASGPLMVSGGQSVSFTIQPHLANSFVMVR